MKNDRVVILVDAETHMMPALAREMAKRGNNLVLGNVLKGLPEELRAMGVKVEVVPDRLDLTKPDAVQKVVDLALDKFGKVDAACIRSGYHKTGSIMDITTKDAQDLYEGNLLSVIYALQAVLKPMTKQGYGQVVINTSSSGLRPAAFVAMYSACRAAANSLVRAAALSEGSKGISINATGTYAMNYPGFLDDVGGDDPENLKKVYAGMPIGKLVEPEEAAYFTASLIDGVGTGQTGQFFCIDNGWAFV